MGELTYPLFTDLESMKSCVVHRYCGNLEAEQLLLDCTVAVCPSARNQNLCKLDVHLIITAIIVSTAGLIAWVGLACKLSELPPIAQ